MGREIGRRRPEGGSEREPEQETSRCAPYGTDAEDDGRGQYREHGNVQNECATKRDGYRVDGRTPRKIKGWSVASSLCDKLGDIADACLNFRAHDGTTKDLGARNRLSASASVAITQSPPLREGT